MLTYLDVHGQLVSRGRGRSRVVDVLLLISGCSALSINDVDGVLVSLLLAQYPGNQSGTINLHSSQWKKSGPLRHER